MSRWCWVLMLGACGDTGTPARDTFVADTTPVRPDTATPADSEIMPDVDADDGEVDAPTFTLHAAAAIPGRRVAVRVDAPEPISGLVAVAGREVRLHRGRGLVTLAPEDAPAAWGLTTRPLDVADVHVDGELTVAAGETLTWAAGTRVVLAPGARIIVHGTLAANGTEAEPVLLTADTGAWAAIEARGEVTLTHSWLVGGGADANRFGGHSGSDPVIAVIDGALTMQGGGIADAVGKAIYSERSTVTLDDVTIARCDTGGEHVESQLTMRDSWVFEIPDDDGQPDDDDNDAIYLRLGAHQIARSVFAFGEDDGVDHNGADLELDDSWIEGFRHEGIATSDGGDVTIRGTVVRDAAQGIEVGYGSPAVEVFDSFVTGCGVGLRWGDDYEWDASGTLRVERTIALHNTQNVTTNDPQQGDAPDGAVQILCSAVATPAWDAAGGNVGDAPALVDGCPPPIVACESEIGPSSCR